MALIRHSSFAAVAFHKDGVAARRCECHRREGMGREMASSSDSWGITTRVRSTETQRIWHNRRGGAMGVTKSRKR